MIAHWVRKRYLIKRLGREGYYQSVYGRKAPLKFRYVLWLILLALVILAYLPYFPREGFATEEEAKL